MAALNCFHLATPVWMLGRPKAQASGRLGVWMLRRPDARTLGQCHSDVWMSRYPSDQTLGGSGAHPPPFPIFVAAVSPADGAVTPGCSPGAPT